MLSAAAVRASGRKRKTATVGAVDGGLGYSSSSTCKSRRNSGSDDEVVRHCRCHIDMFIRLVTPPPLNFLYLVLTMKTTSLAALMQSRMKENFSFFGRVYTVKFEGS